MRQSDNGKISFQPFSDACFGARCDGHSPSSEIGCPEKAFACWRRVRTMMVASCAVLMVMFCSWTYGQAGIEAGTVTGTVKDQTGALVVGAQCILTNQATNVSQTAISTSAGAYTIPFVNTGTYTLKVEAKGFGTYRLVDIRVPVGSTVTEDVKLKVGVQAQQVTVTSAAPLLQAQSASLGMTVGSSLANNLPIKGNAGGRGFLTLLDIAPGAQPVNSSLINGVQSGALDVRVNGADDNAEVFGGQTIPPIPDAIQEFKLQSGNNNADLGHSYGSVVNVVTKTGTNKFKGEVWEYNENDMYNANDYFNKLHQVVLDNPHQTNRPGKFKENSFGGLFGGPVILPHYHGRDKTFFMVDFQDTYFNNTRGFTTTVPTQAMEKNGFTDLSDTLTLNYQTNPANAGKSEKEDAEGRFFQMGMMLDPATTRAIPCGAVDPITGMVANCNAGYVVTNPDNIAGNPNSTQKYAIVRDPFLSGAGCPSVVGTTVFNSTYNQGSTPASCFNQLPVGRLDPNALALLKLFPAPNQQNPSSLTYGNNYFEELQNPIVTKQYDIRVDHTFNSNDSGYLTFSHYNQSQKPAPPFQGVLEGGGSTNFWQFTPTYLVVLTETHVFGPHLINQFRAADEQHQSTTLDPGNIDSTLGIPAQYGIQGIPQTFGNGGLPTFTIGSNINQFGSRVNFTREKGGAWQFSDELTKIVGRHEWRFGGEYDWIYGDIGDSPTSRGNFAYNGEYVNTPNSGDNSPGMAAFLLLPSASTVGSSGLSTSTNLIGGVSAFNGSNSAYMTYHAPYIAMYANDVWKITPNLTANLGMRYEYFGPYASNGGREANFWMGGAGNTAAGSAFYIARDGCATAMSPFFKGLLAYDNIPIICEPNNTANEMPKANWSPRIGFAYRIRPNLVARLGAGVAYGAFNSVGGAGTLGTNYPFSFIVQSAAANNAYTPQFIGANGTTTATMENTFGYYDLSNPVNSNTPLGGLALFGKQYHFHVPHVTTLDFAVQWQFTNHDSIQATYDGQIGTDLESADPYHNAPNQALPPNLNAVTLCATASNPYCATSPLMPDGSYTIPFPNLATLSGPMEYGEQVSNYQSGQLEYEHQYAAGFTMDANYTFARCWSDAQGGQQNEGGPGNGRAPWVQGFGGFRADYDRCSNTAANVFKLTGEYALPFGTGARWAGHANAVENAFIGGWKLDPIWTAASGILSNIGCQGTNGYGNNPNFTGPWFQTRGTAWGCNAPTVAGQPLYGSGPKDIARTRTTGFWNSSAFTAPQYAVQQVGQQDFSPWGVRGNQIYGPGGYDIDVAIHKSFQTTERTSLQVVAESFNVLNHPWFNNPNANNYTNPSGESLSGGWGTITGDHNGPRTWEFASKFFF